MKTGGPVNQSSDIAKVVVGICSSGPGEEVIKHDPEQSEAKQMSRNAGATNWEHQSHGCHIYVAGISKKV